MATTTRKRKRVTKKKATAKSKIAAPVEIPKHISLEDIRQIENKSKDVQISQGLMAIEEQALRNMILEYELLGLKIARQREVCGQRAEMFEARKGQYAEFKKSISPKYGLKPEDALGYNPDTREIVR